MELVTVVALIIVCLLLGALLAVAIQSYNTLLILAGNQVKANDQAQADTTATAKALLAADAQRQTRDPTSGEDVVNTRIKEN